MGVMHLTDAKFGDLKRNTSTDTLVVETCYVNQFKSMLACIK